MYTYIYTLKQAVISTQYMYKWLKSHLIDNIEVTLCASIEKKRVPKIASDYMKDLWKNVKNMQTFKSTQEIRRK